MSQNAYALFQTIKKIKGYIMINTYSMSERRQEKVPMTIASLTSNINSVTDFTEHSIISSPVTHSTGLFIPTGPYTHMKIIPLIKDINTTTTIRISAWSQIKDTSTWVAITLYIGQIYGIQTTSTITINNSELKTVYNISQIGFYSNNYQTHQLFSQANSNSSLIVPQFGSSYIEINYKQANAASSIGNAFYSYCST